MENQFKEMLKDMWKGLPTAIKVAYLVSILFGLTVTGLVVVLLLKLIAKL